MIKTGNMTTDRINLNEIKQDLPVLRKYCQLFKKSIFINSARKIIGN
ncbi:MAG: hypothetical protein ACOCQ5_02095 [Halanaerobiales bacterium]